MRLTCLAQYVDELGHFSPRSARWEGRQPAAVTSPDYGHSREIWLPGQRLRMEQLPGLGIDPQRNLGIVAGWVGVRCADLALPVVDGKSTLLHDSHVSI